MRRLTLLFLCLLMVLPHTAYADSGDFMDGEVQVEPPGFLERAGAAILNNIAKFLIEVLGLKDINTLVYQNEDRNFMGETQELVYNTFPASVWEAVDRFYDIFSGVAYYLLAIAIMAWALIALFSAGDAEGQLSLRELAVGVLIYVIGMYLAGHLIRLFFLVNDFIIAWSVDVLRSYGYDPYTSGYIGEVITRITDTMETGQTLGAALLFLIIVFVVAALNYQYVVRLLVMSVMIVLLPLVLFASIFPASRRAFDIWVREFAVQAWLPAAHAIAFSLFFAIMSERDPASVNFIMVISMLLALTSVAPLMRLVLGAPGGKISGALGFGSVAAISMMLRHIRGGRAKATVSATPTGTAMPNTNMAQGLGRGLALGAVASGISGASMAGGVTGAMAGKGAGDLLKSFGAGVVRQGVGMATGLAAGLAATAMTGNMEAGVLGAMKGHQVGKSAAGKAMNFASGLYSHLSPYKGEKAPYEILSPMAGEGMTMPQLPQSPSNILPSGMSHISNYPANMHLKPEVGSMTSSGGMSEHVRPVMNPPASSTSVNQPGSKPESGAAGTISIPRPATQQTDEMTPAHGTYVERTSQDVKTTHDAIRNAPAVQTPLPQPQTPNVQMPLEKEQVQTTMQPKTPLPDIKPTQNNVQPNLQQPPQPKSSPVPPQQPFKVKPPNQTNKEGS
ncbi:MAG: hypothetical protein C0P68_010500 [Bacillota bacterium]